MPKIYMKTFIEDNPLLAYLIGGGVAAFIMAMLRSGGFTMRNFRMRLSEALMCSMLSSAFTIVALERFQQNEYITIPISIFCGFLGTDFISSFLKGLKMWHKHSSMHDVKNEHDYTQEKK